MNDNEDDNVVYFDGYSKLDIPISRLKNVPLEEYDHALILCVKNGEITPYSNKADITWATFIAGRFMDDAFGGRFE